LIPPDYYVPQKIFGLLTKQDQQGLRKPDQTANTISPEPRFEPGADNSKAADGHVSQWEIFYQQITDLAKQRNLNVRTL
jgi:hypothetical protein